MLNVRLLDALKGQNQGRPPVWIMRQAGRYMPEYRALRGKHDFLTMVHQPELAAEVTLLPIRKFGFDAAILFSDILVVAEAFKVGLHFEEGRGPIIERPLSTAHDVSHLPNVNANEAFDYVAQAIKMLRPQINVPLIGFSGAPFTVASYMIEGGSSRDLKKTKQWLLRDPASFHALLDKITQCTIDYLQMQIDAGVQALQIFDSWVQVLAYDQFREFSLGYLKRILDKLKHTNIPIILFCRGSSVFAPQLAEITPAGISLDWQCNLKEMRSRIPHTIALQGNLDPDILYADIPSVRQETKRLLKSMQDDPRYIFNLGHGIHPDIPVDAVKAMVDCVQEAS